MRHFITAISLPSGYLCSGKYYGFVFFFLAGFIGPPALFILILWFIDVVLDETVGERKRLLARRYDTSSP